ncbi:MAG: hypothetical protein ACRDB0_01335 [Paraclostridium sp.]
MNSNNPTQQERRSVFSTIKRWFGNKAEAANDAMDSDVSIEVQLDRQLKNMQAEKHRILNDRSLMELRGTLQQVSDELKEKRKIFASKNYDVNIKRLIEMGKEDEAISMVEEKEDLENEINDLKEMKIEYTKMDEQVQEDLKRLERDIKDATKTLQKLKTENSNAKKKEEMYALMNRVSSVATNTDTTGIKQQIDQQKRVAYGTQAEYNRRNESGRTQETLRKADLKSKLDSYR